MDARTGATGAPTALGGVGWLVAELVLETKSESPCSMNLFFKRSFVLYEHREGNSQKLEPTMPAGARRDGKTARRSRSHSVLARPRTLPSGQLAAYGSILPCICFSFAMRSPVVLVLMGILSSCSGAIVCTDSNMQSLLADHATSSSCWTVITKSGVSKIYDVTRLLRAHEGGRAVVQQMCGVDGTISFYCNHGQEELQESLDDGDMSLVCEVTSGRRSLAGRAGVEDDSDSDDDLRSGDDDDVENICAQGGTLPNPPNVDIPATEIEQHASSSDCWTALGNVALDITKYLHLHPGGQSTVLTMCGRDATEPYRATHNYHYIRQGVIAGWITTLGSVTGAWTPAELPDTSSATIPSLDMATLQTHNQRSDCWVLITEFVYDVTEFWDLHPAGGNMFICGGDNTAIFSIQHANDYLARMSQYLQGKIASSALADAIAPTELPQNKSGVKSIWLLSEVSSHSTADDCWVVLHCEVLDVTAFIPRHTGDRQYGGVGAVAPLCGTDASNEFDLINHPGSYVDLSVAMGAVRKGRLAGCSDIQAFLQSSSAPQTTTVQGTANYQISFRGIANATAFLHPSEYNRTVALLAHEVTMKLSATGHSNLRVRVHNLTQGSLVAHVEFQFTNYQAVDSIKSFAMHPNGLEAVAFQGQTPVVLAGPTLAVSYMARSTPPPTPNSSAPVVGGSGGVLDHKITLLQVSDHDTETDCWFAVHGQVWFCANGGWAHTGGSLFKKGLCGTDATKSFDAIHSKTYLDPARMQQIGCVVQGLLSNEQGAKLTAQVEPTVLPGLVVQLTGGGEVALADHSSESNCWMAIRGNVYQAGKLLQWHEGGLRQVKTLCGIDATAAFDCVHDLEELQEGVEDYRMSIVGTVSTQLGRGCTWVEPPNLPPVEGYLVAEHATSGDCWSVLHGVVWDLTAFVLKHTGGSTSIVAICGADGTESLDKNHRKGYLSTLQAKGLPIIGKLASDIPAPTLGTAAYPAVSSAELARHNTRQNCWTAVHGHVLDITGFMNKHSGGAATLTPTCGKDGSASFDAGGHPHSYIAMMVNKQQATLRGCLDQPCGGASPGLAANSTAPSTIPSDPGTKTQVVEARKCTSSEPSPPLTPEIDAVELATHNTPEDCWMVLGCGVYDTSQYKHSGGDGFVHAWCGKDGTASFSSKHNMNYLNVLLAQGAKLVGKAAAMKVNNEVTRSTPIPLADLIQHSTPDDCWSCIGGHVYDLTYFHSSHEAGSAVVLPMCGADGTLALLIAHAMDVMEGIPTVGTCNMRAEKAFTEQNVLDAAAFGLYVVLPFILIGFTHRCLGVRAQDRLLRRPIADPRSGFLGDLVNGYLEMPLALALLLVLYLAITAVLYVFWVIHYNEYYPDLYAVPGAAGRMAVYHICLSAYIGTRRFTWSWWLLRLPYERALKTHYVVGLVAAALALVHGFAYLDAFKWKLPETVRGTGVPIIIGLCVLVPFTFPNFRVKFYGVFRLTHYAGPAIIILTCFHIASLNADGKLARGFHVTMFWVASAALFWVCDYLQTCWDAFMHPVTIDGKVTLLPSAGDAAYLAVVCRKRTNLYPGCWMSVASPAAKSALSHPFTTIVLHDGGHDGEEAVMEFIWKVNRKQWTERMYKSVEAGEQTPRLVITGPFGGGLGAFVNLEKIRTMVFVCAGVGVTPVASMMDMFSSDSRKSVHVVWSFRSLPLFEHTKHHFAKLPDDNCHFHFTSKDQPTTPEYGSQLKAGRPNLAKILEDVRKSAEERKSFDIGVFVCGPNPMVVDVLKTTREINNGPGQKSYFHVHSESFQM